MRPINERLQLMRDRLKTHKVKIMIIGLGSVGQYLLDYIMSRSDEQCEIVVAGRNYEKMVSDVNIVRVASLIRRQNRTNVFVDADCDLDNVEAVRRCIQRHRPDFIVNSSRVYAGLKYGSISWHHLRAYGIWSPLAIKYIRNIMDAYELAESGAVVINTSYSDAVIPWLKSAGRAYPDFGSGNFNHLIPRIQLAAAELLHIQDFWNIQVYFATAHFHDVVISKEGQAEGMEQLLRLEYQGKALSLAQSEIFARCRIPMPVDAKRNMMNASSNYDILYSIIDALRGSAERCFNSPGAFGEIGGYPVRIDAAGPSVTVGVDERRFTLAEMRDYNRRSLYFDGVEKIEDGCLFYTDELVEKVQRAFQVSLGKKVAFDAIDETADYIIENIIKKNK